MAQLLNEAGAEVTVMDRAPVMLDSATAIRVDLAQRDSIDSALSTIKTPIDALFSCAGVADGTPGIERINFVGQRYLIEQSPRRDLPSLTAPARLLCGRTDVAAPLGGQA